MKYLVIGAGSIGSRHVKNIADLDDKAEFTIVRNSKEANKYIQELKKLGLKINFSYDLRKALKEKYDGCLITNPTSLHVETAKEVIPLCANILIEKPLSHNIDGVEDLKKLATKHKCRILVAYCLRFHPVVKKIKEIIDSGDLGKIYYARASSGKYLPDWRPGTDYSKSYSARKELGGGVILDLSHEIDYMYWLFGYPKKVMAISAKLSNLKIESEDFAEIIMKYQERVCSVHLDYLDKIPVRPFEAIGEKGTLRADLIKEEVFLNDKRIEIGKNQMYLDEIGHFIACIRGKEEPLIPLKQGIDVLRICMQAKQQI